MTTPYTYLIGWPEHNKYYYGVRFAKGCHPSELWVKYFTSSKTVEDFVRMHGAPTLKEVRKVFSSADKARLWENKVLKRISVVQKQEWLNKTDNLSIAPQVGADNPATRVEVKSKISNSIKQWYQTNTNPRLGTTTPQTVKEKQSKAKLGELNPFYNKVHTDKNIKFFSGRQKGSSNSFYGKAHSEETKQKLSIIHKGKIKPTTQCPHCGKVGGINTMPRWHFNNCKEFACQ